MARQSNGVTAKWQDQDWNWNAWRFASERPCHFHVFDELELQSGRTAPEEGLGWQR